MKVSKICDCSDCGFGMALCPQCGQLICKRIIAKRKVRNMERLDHCASCLMKPTKVIVYHHPVLGKIECYPWDGEVNEDFYPVDGLGELVKPGERICGHKDCVNRNHIEPFQESVVLDADLFFKV